MVLIPYAMNYTSTVRARIPKLVACEQCSFEYVYIMERTGQGTGTSMLFLDNSGAQDRAAASAHNEVMMKLERSCDPVPCPACGWYQQQMVIRARYLRYRWMTTTAIVLFIVSGFFLLFALGFTMVKGDEADVVTLVCVWGVLGLVAGLVVLCPILKRRWTQQYDPNQEEVETRKQLGQERALGKDEFVKLLRERQAAEESV